MPTKPNRDEEPKPQKPVCVQCRRGDRPLEQCTLTGMGDHPRRFLVCGKCIGRMMARSPTLEGAKSPASAIMSEAEKRYETRRQKAFDRLGTDNPRCAFGDETDWRCMELHHLEGERFGKTLVIVCRNCHRKLSDAQKDQTTTNPGTPPTTNESIGHFLQGLADLLRFLADKLWEYGEYLLEQAGLQTPTKKPQQS